MDLTARLPARGGLGSAAVTAAIESFLADYGLWAVFVLMAIDAVLPGRRASS